MKNRLFGLILLLLSLTVIHPAQAVNDLYLVKGDNQPYYYGQIVDSSGTAVDLTGCTVTASVVDSSTGTTITSSATCAVTNYSTGMFEYHWSVPDTASAGIYYMFFKVINGGAIFTVPTQSKARVVVVKPYR